MSVRGAPRSHTCLSRICELKKHENALLRIGRKNPNARDLSIAGHVLGEFANSHERACNALHMKRRRGCIL